jgi:hypothetical protein
LERKEKMPKLTRKEIDQERQNADPTALLREDESAATGDDVEEFNPMMSFGRSNKPPDSLEKTYSPTTTPEEIYKAEMDLIKGSIASLPETITKWEEEEENPVGSQLGSPPAEILPERSMPESSLIPRRTEEGPPPQIPGAASQGPAEPQKPLNPFAGYQPPGQGSKPESGLPWKPPGSGGGGFGKSVSPDLSMPVTRRVEHDCITVHGFTPHEEWAASQKKTATVPMKREEKAKVRLMPPDGKFFRA